MHPALAAPRQGRRKEIPAMLIRPRTLPLLLVALLTVLVAGCGGSKDQASGTTDVNHLLQKTFAGGKKLDSGRLDLTLKLDLQGGQSSQLNGPITLKLSGPFQTQGKGKLPLFDMDASFQGAGQSFKAGLESTGDKGFVNFQGTDYAVTDQVFQQFRTGYEQAQQQSAKQSGQSLATLGIDPRRWLTNPRNEGEAKVGDADVVRITGDVDVAKLLDDVNNALDKARGLGVQGSQSLPQKLTDAQKQQAQKAIKALSIEIDTGKADTTLRRMLINLDVATSASSTGGAQSGKVSLDFQLLDLNKSQSIKPPASAKPFAGLLSQLGGLGLGTGATSGSGSSGSSGSGSSGGASATQLKKYSDCITAAGSDTTKAQKCADLLSSP
jgi:hypothetical protein